MTERDSVTAAELDELQERLRPSDGDCPFCGRDPFHRVHNGLGYEAVAVECCEMGIALYQYHDEQLVKDVQLRAEAADALASLRKQLEEARETDDGWKPLHAEIEALRADNAKKDEALREVEDWILYELPAGTTRATANLIVVQRALDTPAALAPAVQGEYSPAQWTEFQRQHTAANPLNVARPAPAPSAGETSDDYIDRVNALCERHGCPAGSSRLDWLDQRLRAHAAAPSAGGTLNEGAVAALASYQQGDADGVMVLVSRQAIDECLPHLRAMLAAAPTTGEPNQ